MLAYVFVHRASAGIDRREYEVRLLGFHEALAASSPAGFIASWTWRVAAGPLGKAFEDWYLVVNWPALGELNDAAVDASRKPAHDEIASLIGEGAGAVYGLLDGDPAARAATYRMRIAKPVGVSYSDFEAALVESSGPAAAVWKRQMVLGPDLEFLVNAATRPTGTVLGQSADITALQVVGEGNPTAECLQSDH